VRGIAELMNYPGVVNGDPEMLEKIDIGKDKRLDGHAPRLTGKGLNAYVAAGVGSDHESTTLAEAREKLRLGQYVMIREGTTAKNMRALLPLVTKENARRCMFVSDDRHPDYLMEHGHMDHSIRMAISLGLDPITAIQMCTCNTAEWFNLRGIGSVTPGHYADLVAFSNLRQIDVRMVFRGGRLVARDGVLLPKVKTGREVMVRSAMNVAWEKVDFKVRATGNRMRVIGVVPNQIVTTQSIEDVKKVGESAVADVTRDILKMAVIERHQASGAMGLGFVKGFGLKGGALAASVAHDSHNIIVVGTNDNDMMLAAHWRLARRLRCRERRRGVGASAVAHRRIDERSTARSREASGRAYLTSQSSARCRVREPLHGTVIPRAACHPKFEADRSGVGGCGTVQVGAVVCIVMQVLTASRFHKIKRGGA
jgi:adenine deaminase